MRGISHKGAEVRRRVISHEDTKKIWFTRRREEVAHIATFTSSPHRRHSRPRTPPSCSSWLRVKYSVFSSHSPEPKGTEPPPQANAGLRRGSQTRTGHGRRNGCLNRTGLAHVKSLRTAGEDYAKLTNSALRCEAQTGRARVLAVVLRDISRNPDRKPDPLRIRWWTPVHGCADRACGA